MPKPRQEQIEEWLDGETTKYFLQLLKQNLDRAYERRAEVFFPNEPFRTQEVKSHLLGMEAVLADLISAFDEKDFSELEEIEDEERVRNPSVRRPGAH